MAKEEMIWLDNLVAGILRKKMKPDEVGRETRRIVNMNGPEANRRVNKIINTKAVTQEGVNHMRAQVQAVITHVPRLQRPWYDLLENLNFEVITSPRKKMRTE